MPEVQVCAYCPKIVEKDKDQYKVISLAKGTTPERVAHLDCYNQHEEEMRRARGGQIKPHF